MEGDARQIASTADDSANSRSLCVLWGFSGEVVAGTGFEPATPCAQGRCTSRLRYAPTLKTLDFTLDFDRPFACRCSGENCPITVPELHPTVPEYPRFIIPPVPKLPPTRWGLLALVSSARTVVRS